MSKERDKQIFLVLLIVALIVCIVLTIHDDPGNDIETIDTVKNQSKLKNNTLEMRQDGFGTVIVDGVGELTQSDFNALLANNDLSIMDVENIVIGDEITNIGYHCIYNMDYLKTVKLGNSINTIRNGSIKNSPSLEYIYLPRSIEKVANDFLSGSEQYVVISDGDLENILSGINTENIILVSNIHSFQDLIELVENAKFIIRKFSSNDLFTTEPDANHNPLILNSGYLQYGPYTDLDKGLYTIYLDGKGFEKINTDDVSVNLGEYSGEYKISNIEITENRIKYDLYLSTRAPVVECYLKNNSTEPVEIYGLNIAKNDYTFPEVLSSWWN